MTRGVPAWVMNYQAELQSLVCRLVYDLHVLTQINLHGHHSLELTLGPEIVNKSGFIQASSCKIQGLFKDFPTIFKDCKLIKY